MRSTFDAHLQDASLGQLVPILALRIAAIVGACAMTQAPWTQPGSDAPSIAITAPTASSASMPSAVPTTEATTRLTLTTNIAERCGSIGGCAAYVRLIAAGETEPVEKELRT